MAREFELSAQMIRAWVNETGMAKGERPHEVPQDERAEFARLRKTSNCAWKRRPGKSHRLVRPGDRERTTTIYTFVKAYQAVFPIATMCRVLLVWRSGYYAWRDRAPSARAGQDTVFTTRIRQRSPGTFGAPRIHAALGAERVHVGRNRVVCLMKAAGLASVWCRPASTDSRQPDWVVAPDLVKRDSTASRADWLWVADMTYMVTSAGFDFLAVALAYHSPVELERSQVGNLAQASP